MEKGGEKEKGINGSRRTETSYCSLILQCRSVPTGALIEAVLNRGSERSIGKEGGEKVNALVLHRMHRKGKGGLGVAN